MEPFGIPAIFSLILMVILAKRAVSAGLDIFIIANSSNQIRYENITNNRTKLWSDVLSTPLQYYVMNEENWLITNGYSEHSSGHDKWRVVIDTRNIPNDIACRTALSQNIPYIAASYMTGSCESTHAVPHMKEYIYAILEMMEKMDSSSIQILTNDYYVENIFTDVLQASQYKMERVLCYRLEDVAFRRERIFHDGKPTIIIATSAEIQIQFLKILDNTPHTSNRWILIPTDTGVCPHNFPVNFICLHSDKTYSHGSLSTTLDTLLLKVKDFESQDNQSGVQMNQTSFAHYMYTNDSSNSRIQITRYAEEVVEIGVWNTDIGINMTDFTFPPFPGYVFNVVVIHEPPFVRRVSTGNGTRFEGYTIDVLDEISRRMGFKYIMYEVPDKQYGIQKNGVWSGIIGQVSSGFADLGAGPISVTAERDKVIDFTTPYYDYAGLQILMRDPALMQSLFVFASVFTWQAWAVWFSLLFGTAFVIYFFTKWKYKTFGLNRSENPPNDLYFTLNNTFWFVMTSVSLAGPEQSPRMFCSRLLVSGFWFFCQIIMATYTANLAAFLTSSRLISPIESIEDLATQSEYIYTVQAGTIGETYFERMANIEHNFYSIWREMSFLSNNELDIDKYSVWDYPLGDTYARLWATIQKTGMVKTSAEGVDKVLNENLAFFHETPMIKYEMSKICGLMTVGVMFSAKPYAFVLPQNSPFLERMSRIILDLQTETVLTKLKDRWWENSTATCVKMGEASGLTFDALGGIFIVMAAGCVLSIMILGIEVCISKYRNCSKDLVSKNKTESRMTLSSLGSRGSDLESVNTCVTDLSPEIDSQVSFYT